MYINTMEQQKTIIPIVGGKGGVGKSLFVANLGIALAEMGQETAARQPAGLPGRHKGRRYPGAHTGPRGRLLDSP